MRIAILGTRGVPANYGGFETFAQELSVRLARRGHDVTVYCRRGNAPEPMHVYERVRLVTLPSLRTKFTDTLSHTFFSTLHLMMRGADVAYYCNAANAAFMWMPRLRGIATILNTDGLEWERAKWNWLGKTYYRMSEYLAAWIPHMLVSDSRVIQRYYREKFSADSAYVAYGADVVDRGHGRGLLKQFGLEPEQYFLFVSRMEPENNAHVVVKAFEGVNTDMKLMMVGSAPFAAAYIRDLKSTRDPRILFPGGLYGDVYKALRANAYVYVNAMEVGGTHPAILEAMGAGNCVLVSDIAYNEETVAEAGVTFANKSVEDLRRQMQHLVDRPDEVARFRVAAVERVRSTFSWESVVDEYEQVFEELLAKARRG